MQKCVADLINGFARDSGRIRSTSRRARPAYGSRPDELVSIPVGAGGFGFLHPLDNEARADDCRNHSFAGYLLRSKHRCSSSDTSSPVKGERATLPAKMARSASCLEISFDANGLQLTPFCCGILSYLLSKIG
jgi:hypothetical protein